MMLEQVELYFTWCLWGALGKIKDQKLSVILSRLIMIYQQTVFVSVDLTFRVLRFCLLCKEDRIL